MLPIQEKPLIYLPHAVFIVECDKSPWSGTLHHPMERIGRMVDRSKDQPNVAAAR